MGGACAFRVVRVASPGVQKCHFTMLLEALPCSFPVGVTCFYWWSDLMITKLFFPFLFPP